MLYKTRISLKNVRRSKWEEKSRDKPAIKLALRKIYF